jgi:hypothetical protein
MIRAGGTVYEHDIGDVCCDLRVWLVGTKQGRGSNAVSLCKPLRSQR